MPFQFAYRGRVFRFRSYSDADAIARRMMKYGTFYEQDLLEYSLDLLDLCGHDDGQIVDVGANFGNHSTFWAALSGLRVISIEANPRLVPILTENLRANARHDVSTVVSGGAGFASGQGRMRLEGRAAGQWGLGSVEVIDASGRGEETFEIHPVEEWLKRSARAHLPVRLLKVDVEGAEVDVLRGAARLLRTDRPEILAEAATPEARQAIDDCLAPLGYSRLARFCSTPTWHYTTIRSAQVRWRLRAIGAAARLRWRLHKLRHSVVSRVRRAA
jgi:FkbM family methyltransferase